MNKNPILAIFIAVITPIILLAANEHLETLNQGKSVIINKNIISKVQERKLILEGSMVGINSVKQLQNSTVNNKLFETMLKGLEDTDNSNRIRGEQLSNAEIVTFDTVLLNDLLEHYHAPNIIDYFSLDVEGSEERIISSLDFKRYKFRCLTIERPTPKVNEILFENGYLFVKNHKSDSFYIYPSLVGNRKFHCQPFEQVQQKKW